MNGLGFRASSGLGWIGPGAGLGWVGKGGQAVGRASRSCVCAVCVCWGLGQAVGRCTGPIELVHDRPGLDHDLRVVQRPPADKHLRPRTTARVRPSHTVPGTRCKSVSRALAPDAFSLWSRGLTPCGGLPRSTPPACVISLVSQCGHSCEDLRVAAAGDLQRAPPLRVDGVEVEHVPEGS